MEKIAKLEADDAELHRRLGLDSINSHKPPINKFDLTTQNNSM